MKNLKRISTDDLQRMRQARADNVDLVQARIESGEATERALPKFAAIVSALQSEIQLIEAEIAKR